MISGSAFLAVEKLAAEAERIFVSAFSERAGGGVGAIYFELACQPTFNA